MPGRCCRIRGSFSSAGDGASFNFVDYGQDGSPVNPCGDPGGSSPTPPTAEGGALRSQDVRTTADPTGLAGSIVRVDPDTGMGLPDNPLFSSGDPNARRIIAYGLRNPFRFAIRPGTRELYVGDVATAQARIVAGETKERDAANALRHLLLEAYIGDATPGFDGDYERALASITAKAFVMPAEKDLYFPPEDEEYAVRRMPNAELRELSAEGPRRPRARHERERLGRTALERTARERHGPGVASCALARRTRAARIGLTTKTRKHPLQRAGRHQ